MVTLVVILGVVGSALLAIALTKSRDGDETWNAGRESGESHRRSCGGGGSGCGGCGGGCGGCGGCGG
jgi:hypothetical protein